MPSEAKHDRILRAAQTCFVQYGFRRTSMDDIAKQAGISRAALYVLFENKAAIFRALLDVLHEQVLAGAGQALADGGPLEERLLRAFEQRMLPLLELVAASPHGHELVDRTQGTGADIWQRAQERFQAMLAQVLQDADAAGVIALSPLGLSAAEGAALLIAAAHGVKETAADLACYRRELARLIHVIVFALRSAAVR